MKRILLVVALVVLVAGLAVNTLLLVSCTFPLQQAGRERLDQIEQTLQADIPRMLCLSDSLATGGQPSEQAFSILAAKGFRSILNLRTAAEKGVVKKERALVRQSGMRYINIPVEGKAPRAEQADEFIRVVKETANHPMFIHCGSANRAGMFMMIYRVVEQGWSEKKAYEEAVRIGLKKRHSKKFAKEYLSQRTALESKGNKKGR